VVSDRPDVCTLTAGIVDITSRAPGVLELFGTKIRCSGSSCRDFSLGTQARENFILCNGMLPDSNAARVINGICQGAGSGADSRFRETFGPKEPTGLEAIPIPRSPRDSARFRHDGAGPACCSRIPGETVALGQAHFRAVGKPFTEEGIDSQEPPKGQRWPSREAQQLMGLRMLLNESERIVRGNQHIRLAGR
jgi:hypothetical protein